MNDADNIPPTIPPIPASAYPSYAADRPLGEHPDDKIPITGIVSTVEAMLRQPRRLVFHLREGRPGALIVALLAVALLCSVVYGVVVGTFSGGDQLWAAPVKIAGGLLICALICLPSLYIFSCLSGSQARLAEVFGLVAGLVGLMTVLLIGFAPVAWVFSQSTESVAAMGSLHLAFWAIATCFGFRFLFNGFAHMKAKSSSGIRVWSVIFVLVMLQMTTALRPLIGTSPSFFPTEKKFFLSHWGDCLDGGDWESRKDKKSSSEYSR